MTKALKNPIDEYLEDKEGRSTKHDTLFKGTNENIDQMTELLPVEIIKVLGVLETDDFLFQQHKIPSIYRGYIMKYLRLQVSKERKSRGEYVSVHRAEAEKEERGGWGGSSSRDPGRMP